MLTATHTSIRNDANTTKLTSQAMTTRHTSVKYQAWSKRRTRTV